MMSELIFPALNQGLAVLCDRFVSSTLSYQLGGDGLTREEIYAVGDAAIRTRWPDLTILLDMPVDRSMRRVKAKFALPFPEQYQPAEVKDRIEQRPVTYHEQVRRNYLALAADAEHRYSVIDADRPIEAVREDVIRAVAAMQ